MVTRQPPALTVVSTSTRNPACRKHTHSIFFFSCKSFNIIRLVQETPLTVIQRVCWIMLIMTTVEGMYEIEWIRNHYLHVKGCAIITDLGIVSLWCVLLRFYVILKTRSSWGGNYIFCDVVMLFSLIYIQICYLILFNDVIFFLRHSVYIIRISMWNDSFSSIHSQFLFIYV